MKERIGEVFSIVKDNKPVAGCTISREISRGIVYYSLAANTDISAEIHPFEKWIFVLAGNLEISQPKGARYSLNKQDGIRLAKHTPAGMRTGEGTIYIEIENKGEAMKSIEAGKIFQLAKLVPYQPQRIVNRDVFKNNTMKFVVMAFDKGTGLSDHAAPGEALVLALEGQAVITYEGSKHTIRAGESFHFAKGGMHAVQADDRFKMALLVTLE